MVGYFVFVSSLSSPSCLSHCLLSCFVSCHPKAQLSLHYRIGAVESDAKLVLAPMFAHDVGRIILTFYVVESNYLSCYCFSYSMVG